MYLDCKPIVEKIESEIIGSLFDKPTLSVYCPAEDISSEYYFNALSKAGDRLGIEVNRVYFNPKISYESFRRSLFYDKSDGIMILSEPPHLYNIRNELGPRNVEGDDHNDNIDKLFCTAKACYEIIKYFRPDHEGLNVTVVGYGKRVGKPLSYLLMRKHLGTVTVTHKYTKNLIAHTSRSDIIVSAVGHKDIIFSAMAPKGSLIIDVGCSEDGKGDVHPEVAKFCDVTPVPGGVGPITTALIMKNLSLKVK